MISQDGEKFECQFHFQFPSPLEEENYKKYTIYVGFTNHKSSDTTVQHQCSLCTIITTSFVSEVHNAVFMLPFLLVLPGKSQLFSPSNTNITSHDAIKMFNT